MFVYFLLVVLVTLISTQVIRNAERFGPVISRWLITISSLVFVFALLSPLYYEFPGTHTVIKFHDGKAIPQPFGMFAWEYGDRYVNMPTAPLFLESGVSIVTDNPKVRKVSYGVSARVNSPDKFYSEMSGRKTLGSCFGGVVRETKIQNINTFHRCAETEIQRQVAYQLYRFNADKSKELALLDNPLDGGQVEKMKQLVEGYLNTHLESEGITSTFRYFRVD